MLLYWISGPRKLDRANGAMSIMGGNSIPSISLQNNSDVSKYKEPAKIQSVEGEFASDRGTSPRGAPSGDGISECKTISTTTTIINRDLNMLFKFVFLVFFYKKISIYWNFLYMCFFLYI